MKLDTHGHIIKGLKKIAGETKSLEGYYSPEYLELFYDSSDGASWTVYQNSLGHNWHTEYHDENIIKVCDLCEPYTMQELADEITEVIKFNEYARSY